MNWISNIFRRGKLYDDLSEEMRLHMEERVEQLMSQGMIREKAERQARVAFGNRTVLEERSREVWQWPTLESISADVRFALRQLRKSPGFTITAVLTLTLAIGANAVVFGVLNALILRPLNVPQAESLFVIQHGSDVASHSYPDYLDLRQRNRSFDDLAVFAISQSGLDAGKDPSNVWEYETSGNYFDALRIQPYLGRFFHASDEHGPNSAPYVVLSYAYWHSHFQDDRTVVGRVVRLNTHPFTILGVAPPGFQGTILFFASDVFVPIVNHEQLSGEKMILNARGNRWMFEMVGRLKPGVTPAQATADLNSVDSYLKRSYPKEESNEPLYAGAAWSSWRLFERTNAGFSDRVDASFGFDPVGGLCQPGQSVCGAGRRPFSRSGLAPGSWFEPQSHCAPAVHRIRAAFARWRRCGAHGEHSAFAPVERVAAISAIPPPCAGKSGRQRLFGSSGIGVGQWSSIRNCSSTPDSPGQSIRDRQRGIDRRVRAPNYRARRTACRPNCDLRRAGHFIDGCCTWTHAFHAQQLRF